MKNPKAVNVTHFTNEMRKTAKIALSALKFERADYFLPCK